MVDAATIDVPNQALPLSSHPALEGEFLWKSQTEGSFTVKRLQAGASYHLAIRGGLNDLAGQPLQAEDWSTDFTTPKFSVTAGFDFRNELSSQPQLALETTYDVRLTDVAELAYFQDRMDLRVSRNIGQCHSKSGDSSGGKRIPSNPADQLPVDRTYDLLVDGLVEAGSKCTLFPIPGFSRPERLPH